MASAHDVAAYITQKRGEMSAMKLQKLVYYAQAWHLVWEEKRLFPDRVEAWANGPVVPSIYREHRGQFKVKNWRKGNPSSLSEKQRESIDAVLNFYGPKTAHYLSDLTHSESPWRDARVGLAPGARSSKEITPAAMVEFYGSL
ncbi:MAG: Panacea domain-containing protein [Solirubrobacterales bacterium]